MIERAEAIERRERADGVRAGGPPQVVDPVVEVILDPGAADKQRHGVDDNAHSFQHPITERTPQLGPAGISALQSGFRQGRCRR